MTSDDHLNPGARPAVESDLDEMIRLDRAAREHLAPLRGGELHLLWSTRPEPPDASLREDLADPEQCVLVGFVGGAVVGYAIATEVQLRDGTSVAEVGELFVEPPARGVGVGEALMEGLLEWSAERGCIGIDARALPGDRATKNFFESFGLVARAISVHRDLRDRPADRTQGDSEGQ
jgi:GNAT superfamily N-acetyltransferase